MQTNDSPPVMDRHHNSQELFLHELPAPEMSPAEIYSQPTSSVTLTVRNIYSSLSAKQKIVFF